MGPRPHNSLGHWSVRPLESSQDATARSLKGHGVVPGSMPSDPPPLLDHRRVLFQTLVLGPHGERALVRVRVRSRDIARAEATPVS